MGRKTKIWLMIAAFFIMAGCIMFGGVLMAQGLDFMKLSTVQYETNEHTINEAFQNISIVADTSDITFAPSENDRSLAVCHEQKNARHAVAVKDDTLEIKLADTRNWYERIGINFGSPEITVYIPQGEYGELTIKGSTGDVELPRNFQFTSVDISESTGNVTSCASVSEGLKIKTSTGDICVKNVSASTADLSVSTGKVTVSNLTCENDLKVRVSTGRTNMSDVKCRNLISEGTTGDMLLKNVVATEGFSIERSTADVAFDGCDAAEVFVKTSTGDVTGSLLTEKVFITKTNTGRVAVPQTTTGGKCQINTDTGDIKISVQ